MRTVEYFAKDAKDKIMSWPRKLKERALDQLRELQVEQPATRMKDWHGRGWTGFEITTSSARVVGTLEDAGKVVVFHAFNKDSGKGNKTRQKHVDRIEERHRRWLEQRSRAAKLH